MRGTSIGNESLSESEAEDDIEDDFEDDIVYLRSLDPKEWKNQDHYKVLGLTKLRFKASDDQIKRAYRQKVLKHHPDKRRGQGEDIREDDDYFTCITKGNIFHNVSMYQAPKWLTTASDATFQPLTLLPEDCLAVIMLFTSW